MKRGDNSRVSLDGTFDQTSSGAFLDYRNPVANALERAISGDHAPDAGDLSQAHRLRLPHEINLADLKPVVAENIVSGREMEIEVRHRELEEIVGALQRHLSIADGEGDVTIFHPLH